MGRQQNAPTETWSLQLKKQERGSLAEQTLLGKNCSTLTKHHRKHCGSTPTSNDPVGRSDLPLHQTVMKHPKSPTGVVSEKAKQGARIFIPHWVVTRPHPSPCHDCGETTLGAVTRHSRTSQPWRYQWGPDGELDFPTNPLSLLDQCQRKPAETEGLNEIQSLIT